MKTSVLILAAGPMWRGWTEEAPKQLAPIAGEPLILRTIRQLKERGYDDNVTVITLNKAIQAVVPRYFEPAKNYWRWETLASTKELWEERTIILHGDTIFSPKAMDTIVDTRAPFMFIGIANKLHAEAYVFTDQDLVLRAANAAIEAAYAGEAGPKPKNVSQNTPRRWGHQFGHWWFYYTLCGLPPVLAAHFNPEIHRAIKGDYTFDIDSPTKYANFLRRNKWASSGVFIDNVRKHMVQRTYDTHPPVVSVPRAEARLCHFMGRVPVNNKKPFIKDIQHVLFTDGLSRDYALMLAQAPRVEQQFHSELCKGVFVFSDSSLRQVSDHIDTTGIEDKLHIVLPAYPDQPDNLHEKAGPFTVLTISNKFWGRGIPLAIEVYRELRKRYGEDVCMKLVCDDVPKSYPRVAGLEIICKRRIGGKLKRKLYREADVFLLLSLMQFGVNLEAMAHGVPTVSTPNFDRGGWIQPEETGFVVQPPLWHYGEGFGTEWKTWNEFQATVKSKFDCGDLAYMTTEAIAHLDFLINNSDEVKRMGRASQEHQRTKHSPGPRNEQVRRIYADILRGLE